MENRLAQDQTTQAVAAAAGSEDGQEALRRYEFLFEMTTQLLAAQHLEEQISLVLDAVTAGLGYAGVMGWIVLPQALRNMAPAIVNRSVALLKGTSLAFVIGVIEFFRAGTIVNGRENASFAVFTFLAAVYFVCCFSLSRLGHRLGQRPGVIEDTSAV